MKYRKGITEVTIELQNDRLRNILGEWRHFLETFSPLCLTFLLLFHRLLPAFFEWSTFWIAPVLIPIKTTTWGWQPLWQTKTRLNPRLNPICRSYEVIFTFYYLQAVNRGILTDKKEKSRIASISFVILIL